MPIMRVSTSVARSRRRTTGSLGGALVALGAAEVMLSLSPCSFFSTSRPNPRGVAFFSGPRHSFRAARRSLLSPRQAAVNSLAIGGHRGLHAGANFRLGDPALVDDHVKVGLGDGQRGQKDAVDRDVFPRRLRTASHRQWPSSSCRRPVRPPHRPRSCRGRARPSRSRRFGCRARCD